MQRTAQNGRINGREKTEVAGHNVAIAAGATFNLDVAFEGAEVGDVFFVTPSAALAVGIDMMPICTVAGTVRVVYRNNTAGGLAPGAHTLTIASLKPTAPLAN